MRFDPLERKRPLNYTEACRHARDLWGPHGVVEVNYDNPVEKRYRVGTKGAPLGKRAYGTGADWYAAFEDAEKHGLS
jgi:hypothetical protein